MERETGIEPATNSLEGCDSTIELLPRWTDNDSILPHSVTLKAVGRLAQLVRASGLHPEGREFEALTAHHHVLESPRRAGRAFAVFQWVTFSHSNRKHSSGRNPESSETVATSRRRNGRGLNRNLAALRRSYPL